jgi:hypothetical protein
MTINSPVAILITKRVPNMGPKFHHVLMIVGVGRLINALLAIFIWFVLVCSFYLVCHNGPLDTLVIFTITISVMNKYKSIRIIIFPFGWLYNFIVGMISFFIVVS